MHSIKFSSQFLTKSFSRQIRAFSSSSRYEMEVKKLAVIGAGQMVNAFIVIERDRMSDLIRDWA
jgi:hypothetical protein